MTTCVMQTQKTWQARYVSEMYIVSRVHVSEFRATFRCMAYYNNTKFDLCTFIHPDYYFINDISTFTVKTFVCEITDYFMERVW